MALSRIVIGLVVLASIACERPMLVVGGSCEINSDCAAPLVCVIDRCRRQCVDSRDCGAGLRCLVDDSSAVGGGCQLEHERECTLTSDCTTGLLCQTGTCTTACVEDRDCVTGATCETDAMGISACREETTELCIYTSDCPEGLVCARDQLCHQECATNRDCMPPRTCSAVTNICELPVDGGP